MAEARAECETDLVERCRAVGIRAPLPVRSVSGTLIVTDDAEWRVHEFAPGVVPRRCDEDAHRWVLEQGALIHRLDVEPAPGDSVDGWYTTSSADWAGPVDRATDAGVERAPDLAGRAAELADLAAWATGSVLGPPRLCHRDLTVNNTLVEGDGTRWLLDWEDCGPHDPVREVGIVLIDHVRDDAVLARLPAAYGRTGGVDLPAGPTLFASGIAVWLNFLAAQVDVLLDAETAAEHREFARASVRGLLRDVPDARTLERCGTLVARAARDAARTMGA